MAGLASLVPELQEAANDLVSAAAAAGLAPRVTSTRRSSRVQASLYRDFLAGRRRYPAAAPGQSPHEYGWAFDLLVTPYEALADVGYTWETWGGAWGGHWGDEIHFELPGAHEAAAQMPRSDAGTNPGGFWDRAIAQTAAIPPVELPWWSIFLPMWTSVAAAAPQNVTVYRK